jgi:hypothetical protein
MLVILEVIVFLNFSRNHRLSYINEKQIKKALNKTAEIGGMLNGLRKSIEKKI